MNNRPAVLAMLFCAVMCNPVSAYRNVNGAIVVHTADSLGFSTNPNPNPCTYDPLPTVCGDLNANGSRSDVQVIWLLAAFPPGSSPTVTAVQFGILHTFSGRFLRKGPCGPGTLEIADPDWPDGTGGRSTGIALAYREPRTALVFPFYWFAIDMSDPDPATASFTTTFHPRFLDAEFADDGSPPMIDRCFNFGTVRWNGTGVNHCPAALATGACCLEDHSCVVTTPIDCAAQRGSDLGEDTTCAPDPCGPPNGACCLPDGSCWFYTQEMCAGYTCAIWGGPSTNCATFECSQAAAACCTGGEICLMLTQADCAARHGWYRCDQTCDPNPCAAGTGACCFADRHCELHSGAECAASGGSYRGDYTTCGPTNPCEPPPWTGACCFPGAVCQALSSHLCSVRGGEWRGDGTICPPDPPCSYAAPTGACCFLESRCEEITYSACLAEGGWWRGAGLSCPPDPPCPWDAPTGECCLDSNGNCEVTTEADCDAHGGRYFGDGSVCGDATCYLTPTKITTWGRIKAGYR